jgi:putative peptide zinc metalloprotease protein
MPTAAVCSITINSRICLRPLSRQLENGVAIVGRGDQFLELPPEGLDFIKWLNEGLTVGHARQRFEARYEPFPEEQVLDVMKAFLECDFIAAVDDQPVIPRRAPLKSSADLIPQRWAQILFSKPALIAWMLLVVPAAILWVLTPELWPRRSHYFWTDHYSIVILMGILIWLLGMVLHETSHWLACRAKGIEATITWTQRLGFFPMSQTVMHNIWAVPRTARFLPLAAGMAGDVFALSLALYLLYFEKAGWLVLPWLAIKLLKFYVLFITMALAAQFWLFSRMDGYFLVSSLLGQRNLQSDTFAWLKSRFLRRGRFEAPASGMKIIYMYTLITLIWGGLFMGQFLLISLPIKIELIWESFLKVWRYAGAGSVNFYDGAAVMASQAILNGLLMYAHVRGRFPGRQSA